jgi:hypothetical protein
MGGPVAPTGLGTGLPPVVAIQPTLPRFLQDVPPAALPGGGGGLPEPPTKPGQLIEFPDPMDLLKKRPVDFLRLRPPGGTSLPELPPMAPQQLLPNNSTPNLQEGLEARVKDPVWFLAMQWLTGEFEAENGGSVAQIDITYQTAPVNKLERAGVVKTIDPAAPLEWAVESEEPGPASPGWRPSRLEYSFTLGTDGTLLIADEYDGRSLDWYHFDLQTTSGPGAWSAPKSARVLPRNLRFEGMPHPRWWRFERSGSNLSRIVSAEPNFLQMLLAEYLLADSNNWYLAPLEQLAGDLRRLTRVRILDAFGVATDIPATLDASAGRGWELFTLSPRTPATLGGTHLYIPNAASNLVQGEPVEDIEFVRDEDANVVWAVERIYTTGAGERINRADAERAPTALTGLADPALLDDERRGMAVFRLMTPVGPHWIPFVPRRAPATAAGPSAEMFLRRGRTSESASRAAPQYRTRIVGESWRLEEEEIPRTGIRVQRIWRFARGSDGAEYFWIGRRKDVQSIERSAGLDFDYVIPAP